MGGTDSRDDIFVTSGPSEWLPISLKVVAAAVIARLGLVHFSSQSFGCPAGAACGLLNLSSKHSYDLIRCTVYVAHLYKMLASDVISGFFSGLPTRSEVQVARG
jgi:hypothetical protein